MCNPVVIKMTTMTAEWPTFIGIVFFLLRWFFFAISVKDPWMPYVMVHMKVGTFKYDRETRVLARCKCKAIILWYNCSLFPFIMLKGCYSSAIWHEWQIYPEGMKASWSLVQKISEEMSSISSLIASLLFLTEYFVMTLNNC